MGFWSGFAQGYTAEKDRIEARKQYQDALDLKKKDMVMQIAQRRAELGMTGDKSGGSSTSAYAASLAGMGVDPDKIARIASEGGPTALKDFRDAVMSAYDPKNPMSPEDLNAFADSTVISVSGGGSVNVDEIANQAGVTLDPTEKEYFGLMSSAPASTTVLTPLPKAVGASLDDKKSAIAMATDQLGTSLDDAIYQTNAQIAANQDPALAGDLAKRGEELQAAKKALDNGAPGQAISLVGGSALGNIIKDQPSLQNTTFGGGWDEALKGTTEQAPQAAPQAPAGGLSFTTPEEAQAAIDAGKVPPHGLFYVNGQPYTND